MCDIDKHIKYLNIVMNVIGRNGCDGNTTLNNMIQTMILMHWNQKKRMVISRI